jgi:hypothetical protein
MRLVEADEAQKRARDPLTHPEWGEQLTIDQYLEREARLRRHPWSARGMNTWLWMGEGETVLASCETYRMRSRVRGGGDGVTFGVASVFTEPALRGRGYCTQMMQALVAKLRLEPEAQASILFSDVGAPLYARAGYVARPGVDRVFEPLEGDPGEGVDALFSEGELARELGRLSPPDDPFVVWPSPEQLDWHLERARIYSEMLGVPRPTVAGARAGSATAFWAAVLKDRLLMVVLLAASSTDEAVALIRAARRVAKGTGLEQVRMWEGTFPFSWPTPPEEGGRISERKRQLAMIAPLRPGVEPDGWRCIPRALWI